MATQTEEVRTIFSADISGLTEAQRGISNVFEQIISKNRKTVAAFDEMTGGVGAVSTALRGLATVAGGRAAIAIGATNAALLAATLTIRQARKEAAEMSAAVLLVAQNSAHAADRLGRLSAASDLGELVDQMKAAREQSMKLNELAGKRDQPWMSGGVFEGLGRSYNNVMDVISPFRVGGYGSTNEKEDADVDLARKQNAQDLRKAETFVTQNLREQSSLAKAALAGDTDKVALRQIELSQERELLTLKRDGLISEERTALVAAKYAAMSEKILRDREILAKARREDAGILAMEAGGGTDLAGLRRIGLESSRAQESARLSGASGEELASLARQGESRLRIANTELGVALQRFSLEQKLAEIGRQDLGAGEMLVAQARARLDTISKLKDQYAEMPDAQKRSLEIERQQLVAQMAQFQITRARAVVEQRQDLGVARLQRRGATDEAARLQLLNEIERKVRDIRRAGGSAEEIENERELGRLKLARLDAEQQAEQRKFQSNLAVARVGASNLPSGLKNIASLQEQLRANKSELSRTDLPDDERRRLEVQQVELSGSLKQARQDRDFDLRFRPGDRNARDARERREQTERDKFDARQEETGGLLNIHRDLNGNAVSGIDPVSGQRVAVSGSALTAGQAAQIGPAKAGALGRSANGEGGSLGELRKANQYLQSIDKALTE
ncbi:MAG: hypothetical protein JSR82_22545 [Verrucomicrobia bacterium]|nr:hypothetical protein [Verrucomicrobiota bacterium]